MKSKFGNLRKILEEKMNKLDTIPDLDKEEIEIFSVAMDGQDKMKEWVDSLVSD